MDAMDLDRYSTRYLMLQYVLLLLDSSHEMEAEIKKYIY